MKTLSILSLSACLSVIAYNAYSLTCGAQPSCSDLGYTQSSTEGCISQALKCPFDQNKYNCVKAEDVFYVLKLNWSAKGDILGKSTWTAYQNGIVIGHGKDISSYGAFIKINGIKVGSITGLSGQRGFFYVSVSKGDTVYIDANDVLAFFVPYYGNS